MAISPDLAQQMQTLHTEIYELELEALELKRQAVVKSRILKRMRYEAFGTGKIYAEAEVC